jgi:hypothetical protein
MPEEESKPPPVRTFFANTTEVHYSSSDFCIEFSVNSPSGTEPLFVIFMTPEAAKTLHRILGVDIENYERDYRKLPEPQLVAPEGEKAGPKKPEIYR